MWRGIYLLAILVGAFLASVPTYSNAHERWIAPLSYNVAPGGRLIANIRVGELFKGPDYALIPSDFSRFQVAYGIKLLDVAGRVGDLPALNMPAGDAGLAVVLQVSTPGTLIYKTREKFEKFLAHKDLKGVLAAHDKRGLPAVGFGELFLRYAKSLIAVGHGKGADRSFGLETEIVALANPYTDDLTEGLPVRVLFKGKPRTNAQVEVFSRSSDGKVSVTTMKTDQAGEARIPVSKNTEYLLDAVVMRPLDGGQNGDGPVWESLWASLTFKTP